LATYCWTAINCIQYGLLMKYCAREGKNVREM